MEYRMQSAAIMRSCKTPRAKYYYKMGGKSFARDEMHCQILDDI